MTLLSRIHKSLDFHLIKSKFAASKGEFQSGSNISTEVHPRSPNVETVTESTYDQNLQSQSPESIKGVRSEFKRKKRLLVIDSDIEEEVKTESAPQRKRLRWEAKDNTEISKCFRDYITPNGKRGVPTTEEIEDFLATTSCSKSLGSNITFRYAKTMILRKINNNRRLLQEKRTGHNRC